MRCRHKPKDLRSIVFSSDKWISFNSDNQICRRCNTPIQLRHPKLAHSLLIILFAVLFQSGILGNALLYTTSSSNALFLGILIQVATIVAVFAAYGFGSYLFSWQPRQLNKSSDTEDSFISEEKPIVNAQVVPARNGVKSKKEKVKIFLIVDLVLLFGNILIILIELFRKEHSTYLSLGMSSFQIGALRLPVAVIELSVALLLTTTLPRMEKSPHALRRCLLAIGAVVVIMVACTVSFAVRSPFKQPNALQFYIDAVNDTITTDYSREDSRGGCTWLESAAWTKRMFNDSAGVQMTYHKCGIELLTEKYCRQVALDFQGAKKESREVNGCLITVWRSTYSGEIHNNREAFIGVLLRKDDEILILEFRGTKTAINGWQQMTVDGWLSESNTGDG